MIEWLDAKNAPKDGTFILAVPKGAYIPSVVHWAEYGDRGLCWTNAEADGWFEALEYFIPISPLP